METLGLVAAALAYFGTAAGDVQPGSYCSGASPRPIRYAHVTVEGLPPVVTNAAGAWSAGEGESPRDVVATLDGPYVDVVNHDGDDARFEGVATPGTSLSIVFDASNANQDELDVFDAIAEAHDLFESFDPGFPFTNTQVTANVGIDLSCGAFWDGELHLFRENTCANTGEIQSVTFHEYGHGVQAAIYGGSQGADELSEGNADVLANLATLDPIIARGFFIDACSEGVRSSDNDLVYPDDVVGQSPHDAGRVIAGVHWDVLDGLRAASGDAAAKVQAGALWHFARLLEQPTSQPDQVLAIYVADDDNGDLTDGTPNCALIDQAAAHHGFDTLCELVGIDPVAVPPTHAVLDVRPSPSRGATRLDVHLVRAGPARLDVYDVSGRHLRTLIDAVMEAGTREVTWDGRDAEGRRVAPGVYPVRLLAPGLDVGGRIVVTR